MRRRVFPFFFPPVSVGLGKSNKHTHTLIILCKVGLTTLIGTLWKMKRTTTVCCISLCSCTEKAMELKKRWRPTACRIDSSFVACFLNIRLVHGSSTVRIFYCQWSMECLSRGLTLPRCIFIVRRHLTVICQMIAYERKTQTNTLNEINSKKLFVFSVFFVFFGG